jgi:protein-S-isoprenylcysteine O-methyltransferase Ste14
VSAAAGVILSLAGVGLALRSALLLAGRGRPQRGPRPPLVIAGPYTRVRNPLLLGVLLVLVGVAVATRSTGLCVAAAVAAVAAHVWVVRFEEPRLQARFGEAYREYLARVPRWVPHVVGRSGEDVR